MRLPSNVAILSALRLFHDQAGTHMKITYLGQAGLLLENHNLKIMIDPYFSDSVGLIDSAKKRRVPVNEEFFHVTPDVMIFTHSHLDHYDPKTVSHFITPESSFTVLAPRSVWEKVRLLGKNVNCVLFDRHTEWTYAGIRFTAVKAAHSDPSPIGVIIDDGCHKYYITGDTLYNSEIFADIPENIYALFLPVNGVGNNMNMVDAARFARQIHAEKVVPIHIGLMDDLTADAFECENKVVAEIYKEIVL